MAITGVASIPGIGTAVNDAVIVFWVAPFPSVKFPSVVPNQATLPPTNPM